MSQKLAGIMSIIFMDIQLLATELGNSNFGYPVFTKEINAAVWSFLGKYRLNEQSWSAPICLDCKRIYLGCTIVRNLSIVMDTVVQIEPLSAI